MSMADSTSPVHMGRRMAGDIGFWNLNFCNVLKVVAFKMVFDWDPQEELYFIVTRNYMLMFLDLHTQSKKYY